MKHVGNILGLLSSHARRFFVRYIFVAASVIALVLCAVLGDGAGTTDLFDNDGVPASEILFTTRGKTQTG
jgi:hypothetical protein